jgi:AcrR family transcriptional regulator
MTDRAPATSPPSQAGAVPAAAKRPRGRPRLPHVDRAILEATLDAFIQDGYEGMSVDGVAERAGVAKATVYRRWPSKQDLLIAAGQHLYEEHVHFPDSGDLRSDLVAVLRVVRHIATQTKAGQAMPRMLREVAAGTSLGRAFLERVLLPRFSLAKEILARAQERGELRQDLDLDLAVASLVGTVIFLHLLGRLPDMPADLPERLVAQLLEGIGGQSPPGSEPATGLERV